MLVSLAPKILDGALTYVALSPFLSNIAKIGKNGVLTSKPRILSILRSKTIFHL